MGGLLSSKVKLFRVVGIDVQLHSMFILFAGVELWRGFEAGEPGWTLTWLGCLWISVLLHEFGHCWGARAVGGDAQEILLWPLGGLAMVEAPMTPWAQFVTTACGPLVNLILAAIGVLVGVVFFHADAWNLLTGREWDAQITGTFVSTNVMLFCFNMIPAFPMDAGRLLQVGLWTRLGFQRATRIAVYTSFVCSGALIVGGLLKSQTLMVLVGLFAFMEAYQTLRLLQAGYFADLDDPWRQSLHTPEPRPRQPGPIARWLARRRDEKEKARVAADEARALKLDDVLRRVAQVGMDGLSRDEKSFLEVESARLRSQKRPEG